MSTVSAGGQAGGTSSTIFQVGRFFWACAIACIAAYFGCSMWDLWLITMSPLVLATAIIGTLAVAIWLPAPHVLCRSLKAPASDAPIIGLGVVAMLCIIAGITHQFPIVPDFHHIGAGVMLAGVAVGTLYPLCALDFPGMPREWINFIGTTCGLVAYALTGIWWAAVVITLLHALLAHALAILLEADRAGAFRSAPLALDD